MAALVVLAISLVLIVGYCTAGLLSSSDETEEQAAPATPAFIVQPPSRCPAAADDTVDELTDSLSNVRLLVDRATVAERDDGALTIGATIRFDNGPVEAVAAIFAADLDGNLFAISSQARDLSDLPDGREVLGLDPVSSSAQTVNACLRD